MKYFDKLSPAVSSAFENRAVNVDKLKYCVKADLDYDGCYYDVYITFDDEKLYILSGYDRLVKKGRILTPALILRISANTAFRISRSCMSTGISTHPGSWRKKATVPTWLSRVFPPDLLKNSSSSAAGSTA